MYTQKINYGMTEEYFGLSTDTKPTHADNGDLLTEIDTGKKFRFDEENGTWHEQPSEGSSGGSGGGGGESNDFIVTVETGSGSQTFDKTPEETLAAWLSCKTVKIRQTREGNVVGVYLVTSTGRANNFDSSNPNLYGFFAPQQTRGSQLIVNTGAAILEFDRTDMSTFTAFNV